MTRVLLCLTMIAMPTIVFGQPRVATPTFSTGGGEYATVVMVTLRVATPGATIRFTQNGSDPTESDPIVASGATIAINSSVILKARAFLNGRRPSQVKTASFNIVPVGGPPVGPGDAAAAGRRSLLALPDGRVLAWLRDDTPRRVDDLAMVIAVAASGAHALALTKDGDVYAWGANNEGQLGDGTHVRRERPVRVHTLSNVVRVVAGRSHSLALTADGRVWAWGSNARGQLGIAGNQVRVPTPIPTLSDVIAIDAGDAHSVAVTRDGGVFAWGANGQGQLGDGSRKQRRTPVRIGITSVAGIAAGSSHTLAMSRDGTVYAWGSGARGELGTGSLHAALRPRSISGVLASAVGAGRDFSAAVRTDGTLMMWGANDSGQLGDGTFVDRSTPTPGAPIPSISTLSLGGRHSIAVTTAGDVWTWGRTQPPAEAMNNLEDWGPPIAPGGESPPPPPTDVSPPTIVAAISPQSTAAWFITPVTVAFECADDSGGVTCPAPVTLSSDGASQVVSGTAVDAAGNQATATVTLNIDQTPPSIVLTDSPDNSTTTATQLLLTGRVVETASGLAETLRCNGGDVPVVQEAFECVVSLRPGVNHVNLWTSDVAGHFTFIGIAITRVAKATDLAIAPDARTMVIREVAPLSLTDESGATVSDAVWESSNEGIAVLSNDDPPVVTAMGAGTATISASKDGRTAESTIIVSSTAVLSAGTVRWTVAPTPGFTMQPPIFTHRVDPSVPDMFIVESKTRAAATLRAVTSEGALQWTQESPGVPLMGDSFGGVIAGVLYNVDFGFEFRALLRVGEAGGVQPWRYESDGAVLRPAQAPDGTLYAIEFVPGLDQYGDRFWDKQAIVLDGATGQVIQRRPFPRNVDTFVAEDEGQICASSRSESTPETVGPIVGSDGRGYLLVRRRHRHMVDSCVEQTAWPRRTIDDGVDLVMLSRGSAAVQPIHAESCDVPRFAQANCDVASFMNHVVPDGIGGVLASWHRGTVQPDGLAAHQQVITRRDENGALSEATLETGNSIHTVGQNGIVYVNAEAGYIALDVRTWTQKWTAELPLPPLVAHPDGGVAIFAAGAYQTVNSAGQLVAPALNLPMGSPVQEFGNWIGVGDAGLVSVAGEFPDATRFSSAGGNRQGQAQVRNPGIGIFLKSHWAFEGFSTFKHLSIRIVPSAQAFWRKTDPSGFFPEDVYGNRFMTFGAGTGPKDASLGCTGTLTKGTNRDRDVTKDPASLDQYRVSHSRENEVIWSLIEAFNRYANDLPYACFPESNPGYYNSNSFARGLQDAVGLPMPPPRPNLIAPGWFTPVPARYFGVEQ